MKLTKASCAIEAIATPEHEPVRGNAVASGDEEFDRRCEDEIIARLDNGNEWAWCTVEVRVSWRSISVSEYLGCCSYDSREDFECDGYGYYRDMVDAAYSELTRRVKDLQCDSIEECA